MNTIYQTTVKELKTLEKRLKDGDKELDKKSKEHELNIEEFEVSDEKYSNNNDLNNKLIQLKKELNKLKKENESLLNKNADLLNGNQSLLDEQKMNNNLILSYKETIGKLNDENLSLKKTIEKYKKEIEEFKNKKTININNEGDDNKENKNNNSIYEDEIVIVNKETTYSKGYGAGTEFSKNGEFKNSYEIKKNIDLNESEILKYHDIIQDMSNMILIYENLFFKRDVKPKNNKELFCYLIYHYINKKIQKIKLNALMNLIIYKESLPKKRHDKTGNESDNENENEIKVDYGISQKRRKHHGK